ncbi:uncharacterized protein BCR38DRAFT_22574 [Pseudomassariella vexata]|uniref:Uncharacterized protein n=1 Tax=Pseudomassariella vexata TaxID=1141098 RepID=A0A1Y2EK19_9PEZI|nr:uncharacterized protein BCR38DRAFT_22574 [Pseudomassariella vexata]ORY71889.1 hypothetical protein BCR38DRAFT_22574 [Pseudomassariella vexata]
MAEVMFFSRESHSRVMSQLQGISLALANRTALAPSPNLSVGNQDIHVSTADMGRMGGSRHGGQWKVSSRLSTTLSKPLPLLFSFLGVGMWRLEIDICHQVFKILRAGTKGAGWARPNQRSDRDAAGDVRAILVRLRQIPRARFSSISNLTLSN